MSLKNEAEAVGLAAWSLQAFVGRRLRLTDQEPGDFLVEKVVLLVTLGVERQEIQVEASVEGVNEAGEPCRLAPPIRTVDRLLAWVQESLPTDPGERGALDDSREAFGLLAYRLASLLGQACRRENGDFGILCRVGLRASRDGYSVVRWFGARVNANLYPFDDGRETVPPETVARWIASER